jgi:hypothetical protein
VARHLADGLALELLGVCTDGTLDCKSHLYGRTRQSARRVGCERVLTSTLEGEGGASLGTVGARLPSGWTRPERPRDCRPGSTERNPVGSRGKLRGASAPGVW